MSDPRALRALAEIRELTDLANPSAVLSKIGEGLRGGLPSRSFSDGRGGGEPAEGFDGHDRWLRGQKKAYNAAANDALRAMRRLLIVQGSVLNVARDVKPDPPCTNVGCENVVTDENRAECSRCRQHRHRHGTTWPKVKVDA